MAAPKAKREALPHSPSGEFQFDRFEESEGEGQGQGCAGERPSDPQHHKVAHRHGLFFRRRREREEKGNNVNDKGGLGLKQKQSLRQSGVTGDA